MSVQQLFCMVRQSLEVRHQRHDTDVWCRKAEPPWAHCSLSSLMSASHRLTLWCHQRSPGNISSKTFHFKACHVVSTLGFECLTKKDVSLYSVLPSLWNHQQLLYYTKSAKSIKLHILLRSSADLLFFHPSCVKMKCCSLRRSEKG